MLVDHYEAMGDRVLRLLAEEQRSAGLRPIAGIGRTVHREWCGRVFGPALAGRAGAERQRRLAQIAAVCDVYTWKLLRRAAGLSRQQTEFALAELLTPLSEPSMAHILAYPSPARGHLYPLTPVLDELRARGHQITVRTLASQVPLMRAHGFAAAAVSGRVEAVSKP